MNGGPYSKIRRWYQSAKERDLFFLGSGYVIAALWFIFGLVMALDILFCEKQP